MKGVMKMVFDRDEMKITLCKECRGEGKDENGNPCSSCNSYGRKVTKTIKQEFLLSEFSDLG